MPSTTAEAERAYRDGLKNKNSAPAVGREIVTDKQIIAWLKGLGVAISAWERRWLARLQKADG